MRVIDPKLHEAGWTEDKIIRERAIIQVEFLMRKELGSSHQFWSTQIFTSESPFSFWRGSLRGGRRAWKVLLKVEIFVRGCLLFQKRNFLCFLFEGMTLIWDIAL